MSAEAVQPVPVDAPAVKPKRGPFSGHLPALDGVRGVAIGLVLLVHFIGDMPGTSGGENKVLHLFTYGSFGVDVFFVLSGFLITGILFDAKRDPHYFRNFYMRRLLRIFPLYYGVLALLFLVVRWIPYFQGPEMDAMVSKQGWAWGYVINVLVAKEGTWESLPYISHFWSLAVEEHFYFLWPLVVWLFSRKALLRICAVVIVGALALRMSMYLAGVNGLAIYTLTPCRFDALCLGGLLAIAVRGEGGPASGGDWLAWLKKIGWRLAIPSVLFIGVTSAINAKTTFGWEILRPLRESCWTFLFGSLLCFALTAKPGSLGASFFSSRVMTFLGKYSYGLYVFHMFIAYPMLRRGWLDWWTGWVPVHFVAVLLQAAVGIAASIAVALLSYHLYEKRFLKLKVQFEAKKA